ncbi:hypothetical protein O3P69_001022 [Scylla paramamosain]|uniref:Adenosine deaminase n=1 Tax=Scylla paramamosain TaxID=85552 RepID=A0AAW0UPE8_SCYPA
MMGLAWGVCCLLVVAAGSRAGVAHPSAGHTFNTSDYLQQRRAILDQEETDILGQGLVLSAEEEEVNKILMAAKDAEMEDGFQTLDFLPSKNFMTVIQQMEESQVFKIIRQMPKGAGLHLHYTAMASPLWVVQEITYWPNLYMCYDTDDHLFFRFFGEPDTSCAWELVSDVRSNYVDPSEFDAVLFSKLSLLTENPDEKYPDINTVWDVFQAYFDTINGLVMYRPAWETYLYHALGELADDNVLYVEFRGSLTPLYELNGTRLTEEESVAVYRDTTQRFVNDNPDRFFGARFIYAPPRGVDNATVHEYVSLMKRLKKAFPDFVAGFDLVGQEDKGEPLIAFVDELLQLSEADIRVFYHAGETNWMGMETDDNIIDALLLNASRIGHGYALVKHPEAKALARERDVPMEVCPISNQVLKLVEDLRNHPAAGLVAEGFPIVVSPDDPGAWGASGLSYDMYEAFMAFGGAKADLRFLKQLAINSINYSSLDDVTEYDLMYKWVEKWNEFVAKAPTLLAEKHCQPHRRS